MNGQEKEKTLQGMLHIPNLKLKLAFEGILVGIATGLCITVLRLCLGFVAKNRARMVTFLQNVPPAYTLIWVACLLLAAVIITAWCAGRPLPEAAAFPRSGALCWAWKKAPTGPG